MTKQRNYKEILKNYINDDYIEFQLILEIRKEAFIYPFILFNYS